MVDISQSIICVIKRMGVLIVNLTGRSTFLFKNVERENLARKASYYH